MIKTPQGMPKFELYDSTKVGDLQDEPIRPRFVDITRIMAPGNAECFKREKRGIMADAAAYDGVPTELLSVDEVALGDRETAIRMLEAKYKALQEELSHGRGDGKPTRELFQQADEKKRHLEGQAASIYRAKMLLWEHPDYPTFNLDEECNIARNLADQLVGQYNDSAWNQSHHDAMALRGTGWSGSTEIAALPENKRMRSLGRAFRRLARRHAERIK